MIHTYMYNVTYIIGKEDEGTTKTYSTVPKEEGPFVGCLDEALASFNVERQAYYSGSFIGNHVNRALKVTIFSTYVHVYFIM